jgi:cytochrome c oxidase subunit 3
MGRNVPADLPLPGAEQDGPGTRPQGRTPSQPVFGGGPPPPGTPPQAPPVSSLRLAITLFIGAEVMLFAGLSGAYLVLRYASTAWPPPGQPQLPTGISSANTAALLLSAVTMWRAWRGIRNGNRESLRRGLAATAVLGTLFLVVQGAEWLRLVRHGLRLSNAYGSTFAALIGLHGLHVLGAVGWLLWVLWRAGRWSYSARRHMAVELCAIYWIFVSALWVAIFALVYRV